MAQNDFLQFDENNENVLTQDAYRKDEQRISGAKSGVARSSLFNKVLRQVSTFVAGFGQFISEKNINVLEDIDSVKNALTNVLSSKNIGVSAEVQELLGADNVDDYLKELAQVKCFWWKRRAFTKKITTSERVGTGVQYRYDSYYDVGTGYEINEQTGEITLLNMTSVNGNNLTGHYLLLDSNTVRYFKSKDGVSGNYVKYNVTDTIVSFGYEYLSDFKYIYSPNKDAYPTEDGGELDGYQYYYFGNPFAKAILLDNSVEADELALIIQNTYELELLKLGIEV